MRKFPPSQQGSNAATARRLDLDLDLDLGLEPLSEQRWSKLEQAVFARLDASHVAGLELAAPRSYGRQRLLLGFAAAAALVVLVLVLVVPAWPGAASKEALSRISTGATASHLALPGLALDVSPESTVVVSGSERESTLIVLDRGEVACDVAHRRSGVPLVVQAGEVRVEVVGTRFRVTRQGESARVAVQEGVVRVKARGQTVMVAAGESWPRPAAPVELAAPEPQSLEQLPLETASDVEPRPRGQRQPARPAPVEPSVPEKPPAPEPATEQQQFEAATRLERSEPGRAVQLYRGLEGSGSSWAMNALFAHGRLEAARGNRAEARRILSQYLERFPQGGNAQDARMLLGRLK